MTVRLLPGFQIGRFQVRPREEKIVDGEDEHHLEPKVMQVLMVLAERQGQVVSRQVLLDEVWSDAVVGDEVLSRAISLLRGYFGDERTNPRFIRTVPRQGYELIESVRLVEEQDARRSLLRVSAGIALAGLLVAALLWPWTQGKADRVVLAVLPPRVLSEDMNLGFASEGIAEHMIERLSDVPAIDVLARRASFGVRDAQINLETISEQLAADYLVEGSLRRDNAAFKLSLFLVDVSEGTNIWAQQFSGEDLGGLETQAFISLTDALDDLVPIERIGPPRVDPGISEVAYRKYLEARHQWSLRGERRIARSIALLRETIELSPAYAPAYLALAQSLAMQPFYTDVRLEGQFLEARLVAEEVLRLSPELETDVQALEGFMLMKEWRWLEAGEMLRSALELDSQNVNARYWYSIYLAQLGQYEQSLHQMRLAVERDPISAVFNDRLALAYTYSGDLTQAAHYFSSAGDLGYPEGSQPLTRLLYFLRSGAWDEMQRYLVRIGGDPKWVYPLVEGLQDPAKRPAATGVIEAYPSDDLLEMLKVPTWVLFGEHDRAFAAFGFDPKTLLIEFLWIDEVVDWRTDPRFDDLLKALNFTGEARTLLPEKSQDPSA